MSAPATQSASLSERADLVLLERSDTPTSGVLQREPTDGITDAVFETGIRRRTIMVVAGDCETSILGRLHAAREIQIDLAGLARLVALAERHITPQPWTVDGDLFVSFRGGMRPLLHHGDLHVRGSLLIDDHSWLICTGNLVVDGIISNHRPSTLAVGGSLTAPRLVTSGNVVALESIRISEVALVRGADAPVAAGRHFATPTLVHEGPNVTASALVVERSVDLGNETEMAIHRPTFATDVLTESGRVDPERCDRALRCGLSLFRA